MRRRTLDWRGARTLLAAAELSLVLLSGEQAVTLTV
jgi:hypothetical protein